MTAGAATLVGSLAAAPDASRRPVIAPFTGEVIYDLPLSTERDVELAAERARAAQVEWAALPISRRSAILLRFHDIVLARRDEILDLVQWETGKARRDANEEVLDVCINARHYARDIARLMRPRRVRGAFPVLVGTEVVRHPVGLVGVISPWNYPLTLAAGDSIPALLAGNAVIVKPDVQTTLTALWVRERLLDAGVPPDVFAVVSGEGPVIGPAVIDVVDHVNFTGSTPTGRVVAERCARRLIPCTLELGGKNAMIIRADADPVRAAAIAERACFANSGQLCISMERIYVQETVAGAFLQEFARRARSMTMVPHVGWGASIGSLISQAQVDRFVAHVEDAVARGARVVTGGHARPDIGPFYVEPTILTDVDETMLVCRTETFGPLVSVYPVANDDEAVERANDTTYGLNAAVITRDRRSGATLARRLHSGSVNINEGYASSWASVRAPTGGWADSGLGSRHGDEAVYAVTRVQNISTQRAFGFDPQFGMSDERWGATLSAAMGLIKKIGLK